MTAISTKDARVRYAVYGALFGFAFPIIATLFDAFMRDLGVGLGGFLEAQRTQPLHWIIDTAPIFLGLFAMVAGVKQQEVVEMNENLELKVQQRTEMLHEQNEELRAMQQELEDSFNRISQSITYAERIQDAIISNTKELKSAFPDSFVMFRPRDIVSGDFPWYMKKGDFHFFAAVDCTGHGVPGAFMSLIGYFLLNKIVKEDGITDTGEILCELHKEVVNVVNQSSESDVHDGMDVALCRLDPTKNEVMYSGAGNPVYHIHNGELTEYKADFWSIGGTQYKKRCPYQAHLFKYQPGDVITMFSDGITDQFSHNGEHKFGFKRIQKIFVDHASQPMDAVHTQFEEQMDEWMGDHRQMDDMLLMGVKL